MRKLMEAVAPLFENEAEAELEDILQELRTLSDRAHAVLSEYYPEAYRQAEAYGALNFGSSTNRYDTTFESIVTAIANGDYDDKDYDDAEDYQ